MGALKTSPCCESYSPNPFVLGEVAEVLKPLSDIVKLLPLGTLPILNDIIINERHNRKNGFHFLEKVGIKYRGLPSEKYVSNYVWGYVYLTNRDGETYLVSSKGFRMLVLRDSIIKEEPFRELIKLLRAEDKLVDPSIRKPTAKQKRGIPLTLDDINSGPNSGFDSSLNSILKKSNLSARVTAEIERLVKGDTLGARLRNQRRSEERSALKERGTGKGGSFTVTRGGAASAEPEAAVAATANKKRPVRSEHIPAAKVYAEDLLQAAAAVAAKRKRRPSKRDIRFKKAQKLTAKRQKVNLKPEVIESAIIAPTLKPRGKK
jgi:hypothetical protein